MRHPSALLFAASLAALGSSAFRFGGGNSRVGRRTPPSSKHHDARDDAAASARRPRATAHSAVETRLFSYTTPVDSDEMRTLGMDLILRAAREAGATEPMIDVEWKADRIVVTVDVNADEDYGGDAPAGVLLGEALDDDLEEGDSLDYFEDEDLVYDGEDTDDEAFLDEDEFDPESLGLVADEDSGSSPIDLTLIARNINVLLAEDGEDSLAHKIAELHEICVTTPEFDNVLRGRNMFESYRGFDVTVEHWEEPKKKKKPKSKAGKAGGDAAAAVEEEPPPPEPKLKITEGKLVGRDYDKDVTMINVKGRVVKIENDKIESVRLPKAKREKGAS
ncbi:hypothetical protein THAOC_18865 [Thalassiosira oceanica]|uniref:Uncharacterized protein n=1 Tax=Thalassiosira oceanica TaxID=159749 RepID=K0SR05_THAOC|nr:hypothetical protein THAOC_18865 [Thalassiosira oceanica]|eukprot:EJK60732.1 hypothetical protein THAOC_18865 [Thalassiosira oceanica]